MRLAGLADLQNPTPLEDVEDLLRGIVQVERWPFARLEHDEEGLGGLRLGTVHHEVVDVRREAVMDGLASAEDESGGHDATPSGFRAGAGRTGPIGLPSKKKSEVPMMGSSAAVTRIGV